MRFSGRYAFGVLSVILVLVGVVGMVELAESDEHEGEHDHHVSVIGEMDEAERLKKRYRDPEWLRECGACHVAYPARFLSAASWRELMAGLDDHFGSDASLDEETAERLLAYLEQHARRKETRENNSGKNVLRITETRWFRREHVEAAARAKDYPKLRNLANCSACHTQAESGGFSEHDIRYPF